MKWSCHWLLCMVSIDNISLGATRGLTTDFPPNIVQGRDILLVFLSYVEFNTSVGHCM